MPEAKDPIVEANRRMLLERSEVGIRKYGTMLNRPDLKHKEWLQHLLEELLDAANYTQAAIMNSEKDTITQHSPDGITWQDVPEGMISKAMFQRVIRVVG